VLLGEVLGVCRRHGVMLEPKMANVVLSTIVLEGVGRTMDPGLNLFKAAMPFVTMRK
jgi:aarF domain-containing kinase